MFAMGPAFFRQLGVSYATLTLTGTYPAATIGVPYSADLTIAGGNGVNSLTGGTGLASGSLPPGLALSIVTSTLLRLSGTPTGSGGTYAFTASVSSGDGQTATSAQNMVSAAGYYYTPLFASGEQGFIVDFNDLNTLFQDTAHTTPVTTVGQSIRAVQDKENPTVFGTCAAGNTLQYNATLGKYFCRFNGSAPITIAIPSALGGNNSKALICAADTTLASTSTGNYVCNLGGAATANSLWLQLGQSSGYATSFGQGGAGQAINSTHTNALPGVLIGNKNVNALELFSGGASIGTLAAPANANISSLIATIGGYPLAGYNMVGDIYSVVCLNRILTSGEISSVSSSAV